MDLYSIQAQSTKTKMEKKRLAPLVQLHRLDSLDYPIDNRSELYGVSYRETNRIRLDQRDQSLASDKVLYSEKMVYRQKEK
ncbi:hypothetical protein HQ40_06105 [Porphyromonas gulae]|uniref:Uncharacterized protein n=1 Tax=Porphyromonas gulae TaxID=111105 RepID=A0A0A2E8L5_9PORP|nr:hypothetical protein HQ40_06105 [Porphyromonas gulae]KGN86277.1 hypothetical protein HR08_04210 [Porphyromonas gulae]